jgi:hypothetical protein
VSHFQDIIDHLEKLGKRQPSFVIMLDHLFKTPEPFIIETGCMRQSDNFEGDGMSTLMWNNVCKMIGGDFLSFDINPESVTFARSIVGSVHKHIIDQDSVIGIKQYCNMPTFKKIDLLYLDSVDLELPNLHNAFIHNMYEFTSAVGSLAPGALICVDDNVPFDFLDSDGKITNTKAMSKGEYLKDYLAKLGIQPIYEGYQIIWKWQ